jgi:hypothetical protein
MIKACQIKKYQPIYYRAKQKEQEKVKKKKASKPESVLRLL